MFATGNTPTLLCLGLSMCLVEWSHGGKAHRGWTYKQAP